MSVVDAPANVHEVSARLLGAHVGGGAEHDSKLGARREHRRRIGCIHAHVIVQRARESEVENLRIDPAKWVVEKRFDAPGPRPHGLALEGGYLWHGDADLNAFFKYDPGTGTIVERILLTDADPVAHGLTIWNNTLWYCDDIGVVCRMTIG